MKIIREGMTLAKRTRLVFAERARSFADLDRLCVASRSVETNDEVRTPLR